MVQKYITEFFEYATSLQKKTKCSTEIDLNRLKIFYTDSCGLVNRWESPIGCYAYLIIQTRDHLCNVELARILYCHTRRMKIWSPLKTLDYDLIICLILPSSGRMRLQRTSSSPVHQGFTTKLLSAFLAEHDNVLSLFIRS